MYSETCFSLGEDAAEGSSQLSHGHDTARHPTQKGTGPQGVCVCVCVCARARAHVLLSPKSYLSAAEGMKSSVVKKHSKKGKC